MAPRGFDLATHFNFHLTDSQKPGYLSGRPYPSLEYRRNFISIYLNEWQKTNQLHKEVDTVDHIVQESDVYGLVHAMFLLSWWIVPGDFALKNPQMLRTFTMMGQEMLKSYFERKEHLNKSIP